MAGGKWPVNSKTGAVGNNRLVVNMRHPSNFTGSQQKQVTLTINIFNFSYWPGKVVLRIGGV